jgi:Flp pilus assembly protein CpaB
MTPYSTRRSMARVRLSRSGITAFVVALVAVGVTGVLWATGLIDTSRLRGERRRSTAGLVPVPTPAQRIPAYARVTRDHLWSRETKELTVLYLPPRSVTKDMLVDMRDVIGRVLARDKQPGYVFTEADFLPKGTREGLVAGIPAGKRAIRVPADKVEGLYGLRVGDRFDLVATMAIDGRGGTNQSFGGVYGQQMALQARLSNWQKQATVRVMVQNGVVVEPMTTRQVPVFQNTLTQGGVTRMRPIQEIVIAVDPDEVARLTEAIAVEAKISTVPRSGRPDDPVDSVTPDLRPTSPFTGPGVAAFDSGSSAGAQAAGRSAFTTVETISGTKRELTAVPRQ